MSACGEEYMGILYSFCSVFYKPKSVLKNKIYYLKKKKKDKDRRLHTLRVQRSISLLIYPYGHARLNCFAFYVIRLIQNRIYARFS